LTSYGDTSKQQQRWMQRCWRLLVKRIKCRNGSGAWGQGWNGEIRNPFSLTLQSGWVGKESKKKQKKQSSLRMKPCV